MDLRDDDGKDEKDEKKFWERDRHHFDRVLNVPLGLHHVTYWVAPQPDSSATLTDALNNWDELVQDLFAYRPAFREDNAHFNILLIGDERDEKQYWRSVGMLWEEFEDADAVRTLLEENRPGSDLDAVIVYKVVLEILLRPHATDAKGYPAKDPVAVRGARTRERKFEAKMAAEHGHQYGAGSGTSSRQRALLRRGARFGNFDIRNITLARPHQTDEWYDNMSARKRLHPIRNTMDNLCLEYCIAVYDYERRKIEKRWAKKQREGKLEVKDMADEVLHAEPEEKDKQRVSDYMDPIPQGAATSRSKVAKAAKSFYKQVWGPAWTPERDAPRDLSDLLRYHNKLRIRIQVFTYNESGSHVKIIYRSWEEPDAREVAENAPLLSLLWTPPPAGQTVGHFDLIPSHLNIASHYLGYSSLHRFCNICLQVYSSAGAHLCRQLCVACGQWGCPGASAENYDIRYCDSCNRGFRGDVCLVNHRKRLPSSSTRVVQQTVKDARMGVEVPFKVITAHHAAKPKNHSMCESVYHCPQCCVPGRDISRFVYDKKFTNPDGTPLKREHKCGWEICAHCDDWVESETHQCFVQKKEWKPPGDPDRYVCVDIEADTQGVHKPYLIRVSVGLGKADVNNGMVDGYDADGRGPVCDKDHNYDADGKQRSWWFEGDDCDTQFVRWCLAKRKKDKEGFTVLAHNGSGYDFPVLYPAIYSTPDIETRRTIATIYRGTALIGIRIGKGDNAIRFVDTWLHFSTKLSECPKMFGLADEMKASGLSGGKEVFPHFLWKAPDDIKTYGGVMQWDGPLPDKRCFRVGRNNKETKKEDEAWEQESKLWWSPQQPDKPKWNFRERAMFYCHVDVEILRRAARAFRDETMASSGGCDPFCYLTTPSASVAVYTWKDMPERSLPNYSVESNKLFRRAMHGGRTEATQFVWPPASPPYVPPSVTDFNQRFSPTEELRKIDVNSLYPTVEVKYRYPVGYPSELWGKPVPDTWPKELWPPDEKDPEQRVPPIAIDFGDDPEVVAECNLYFLNPDYFAFCVVDVTPPTDLLSPVLPTYENGKLKFTLRPGGQFGQYAVYSPLLRRAVEKGYKIDRWHGAAVWTEDKFPPLDKGVWLSYVRREMRIKDEASGFPHEVKTAEQKAQWLYDYSQKPLNVLLDLALSEEKMVPNEGRKAVAKLRLNNLWGKFTQKEQYSSTVILTDDDVGALYNDYVWNSSRRILRKIPLRDNMMEIVWEESRRKTASERAVMSARAVDEAERLEPELDDPRRNPRPSASMHSVIPGALVPMYAQLFMYDYIERLGDLRGYMDTDSLVYRFDPQNPSHVAREIKDEVGHGLGYFKDELVNKDGSRKVVRQFRSGGAKNYLLIYDNGSADSTVKGIQKGRLNPEYQAAFLRAKTIQEGLGLPDSKGPSLHNIPFGDKPARNHDKQVVYTKSDAQRVYSLVNDKLELFPDGSTLPYGHEQVEAKRAFFRRWEQREFWLQQLEEANRLADSMTLKQDEWEGRPPGMSRHLASKRRAESEIKEEKQREVKQARILAAGEQERRREEKELQQNEDHDEEKMEDVREARAPRPDPAVFEGLMEVD